MLTADCTIHLETGATTAICALIASFFTALGGGITWVAMRVYSRLSKGDEDFKELVQAVITITKEQTQAAVTNAEAQRVNSVQTAKTFEAATATQAAVAVLLRQRRGPVDPGHAPG